MLTDNPAALQFLLQDDLYLLKEDKAYYAEGPVKPVIETPRVAFNCLGGNKKHLLIMVNYTHHEHMEPAHLKALESTLGRKNLTLDDVAIVNAASHPAAKHQQLTEFFKPEKLLILGAGSIVADTPGVTLNAITTVEKLQVLFSYGFDEMLADREKAKAFWEQMKNF